MKKRKHKTIGSLIGYIIDSPQAYEFQANHEHRESYQKWVFSQINEALYDEENPSITLEFSSCVSILQATIDPFGVIDEHFGDGCTRCYNRMKAAYEAKITTTKHKK